MKGYKAAGAIETPIKLCPWYHQNKDNGCEQDKVGLIVSGFWWRWEAAEFLHTFETLSCTSFREP